MTVLFGHPSGNPNSHQAALAHFEAGWLEAFCVPWMPSVQLTAALSRLPGLRAFAARLSRRTFEPLAYAPKIEGRIGEWRRLLIRAAGRGDEGLSYQANDWLMQVMSQACARQKVTAVHAYEDCSLLQFRAAKNRGLACIYDMPIGYHPAWTEREAELAKIYADWLPDGCPSANRFVRPAQNAEEMQLADCVLAPSAFVADTILQRHPDKLVRLAPYGIDVERWQMDMRERRRGPLRVLFVGQCSLRKGVPLLLEAWRAAALEDATLDLVGGWQLSASRLAALPPGVNWCGPVDRETLQTKYQAADAFVFPTFFEGRALVVGEAMACGLPVITTRESGASDLVIDACGRIVPSGDRDALAQALIDMSLARDSLPMARLAARAAAERASWPAYRDAVRRHVEPFV